MVHDELEAADAANALLAFFPHQARSGGVRARARAAVQHAAARRAARGGCVSCIAGGGRAGRAPVSVSVGERARSPRLHRPRKVSPRYKDTGRYSLEIGPVPTPKRKRFLKNSLSR
jgi:hypothetical protein